MGAVLPTNAPAFACYKRAGFERAAPQEEAAFNAGQPREYVWMRLEKPVARRLNAG
jgi:RimJ/RimL family protein N-acetyltransferase